MSCLFPLEPRSEEERLQFLYDRLAARFGFGAAIVRLSGRKLTGGQILYGTPHRITISAHLSPAYREDTLRHEAAHAWAHRLEGPTTGHGRLFRCLARRIGATPGQAPETDALRTYRREREVLYGCEGCSRVFRRMRAFRGARFCVACERAGRPSRLRRLAARDSRS